MFLVRSDRPLSLAQAETLEQVFGSQGRGVLRNRFAELAIATTELLSMRRWKGYQEVVIVSDSIASKSCLRALSGPHVIITSLAYFLIYAHFLNSTAV